MYLHSPIPQRSFICGLNDSRAMCRLDGVSGASKTAKTQLFFGELGCGTLQTWKESFIESPPLSPPIFTQSSPWGMRPSCQVSLFSLFYVWFDIIMQVTFEFCMTITCDCIQGYRQFSSLNSPPIHMLPVASPVLLPWWKMRRGQILLQFQQQYLKLGPVDSFQKPWTHSMISTTYTSEIFATLICVFSS